MGIDSNNSFYEGANPTPTAVAGLQALVNQATTASNAAIAANTTAQTASTTATTEAGIATTQATNASASATAAASSATAASGSASAAATSATNAASSATAASGSASSASTSATNAATSAASALANWQLFEDAYYGALASDPSLNPTGGAMRNGDMYYNTTSNVLRVRVSGAWQNNPSTAGYLVAANNLSDVGNATTARGNLTAAKSGANTDLTSLAPASAGTIDNMVLGGTTPKAATVTALNGGPLAGFRNRIINGGFGIDQRNAGAAQTITAGAALAYTVDRFYAYSTGANVTGQRIASSGASGSPSQYVYQFTGAASVTAIGFGHRIESINSFDLSNTTATLSVSLANSLLTTVTWTAYYANSADTFGSLASPTRTQIATGTFTVNSTLSQYSTQISIPSAATTGIEIVFTVGAQTSGTWKIGNIQLEAGSVATPFERRSMGAEMIKCCRYYQRYTSGTGNAFGVIGYQVASSNVFVNTAIPPMRASPTSSIIGTWGFTNTSAINIAATGSVNSVVMYATATATGSVVALSPANGGFDLSAEL